MTRLSFARKTMTVLALSLLVACAGPADAGGPQPVAHPADIAVEVVPGAVEAGERARVTVTLAPKDGIKINRYPKIKLSVPQVEGLTAGAEAAVGNAKPPPPHNPEINYFKVVEPVSLELEVQAGAARGRHEIPAQIKYFYCVAKSGYCAPKRAPLKIPLTVQ